MEAESRVFVLKRHSTFLSPLSSVIRSRSTSGSADELRRRYELMNQNLNTSRLERKRRGRGAFAAPLAKLRAMLREAVGYSAEDDADTALTSGSEGTQKGLLTRRSSRLSGSSLKASLMGPARAPASSFRPLSLATSALLFSLGFGFGLVVGVAKGARAARS
jgi:hypothetical protein